MTNEELAVIEARAKAVGIKLPVKLEIQEFSTLLVSADEYCITLFQNTPNDEGLRQYIEAACNSTPALIAEIRRLQAEIERLTPKNKPLGIGRMYEDL